MSDETVPSLLTTPTDQWPSVQAARQLDALYFLYRSGAYGDWDDAATKQAWESASMALRDQLHTAAAAEVAQLGGDVRAVSTWVVVAGELIESAWGNQVRADLLALDSGKLSLSGGTMAGQLDMANNFLIGLPNPVHATGAVPLTFADNRYVNVTGDTIDTGDLIVGNEPSAGLGVRLRGTVGDLRGRVTITSGSASAGIPPLSVARSNGVTGHLLATWLTGPQTTVIGSVSVASASSVAYNTTSDRRLKEQVGDVADAADLVQQLGHLAYRGRWIADAGAGQEWVFLNSQDVEPIAPFAVHGDAYGTDPDSGDIVAQQLDHSALVPLLAAALAQALDRADALEARIQALEGGAT